MVMYGQNKVLVDDLCAKKEAEGLVRDHPDFEGRKDMQLYWVRGTVYPRCRIQNMHGMHALFHSFFLYMGGMGIPHASCFQVVVDLSVTDDTITSERMSMRASLDADSEAAM